MKNFLVKFVKDKQFNTEKERTLGIFFRKVNSDLTRFVIIDYCKLSY